MGQLPHAARLAGIVQWSGHHVLQTHKGGDRGLAKQALRAHLRPFYTVVSTLVLCGVDDQPRTVREIRRVLKPGGRFLFIEHVRSDDDKLARRQDRINLFNRLTTSCDCNRPTLRTLQRGGLVVEDVLHGDLTRSPSFVRPMIVGSVIRPADALAC